MKTNKAIFVCGSGGVGKSTFIKKNLKNYKHIDVDIFYEELLKDNGLGLKIKKFSNEEISLANRLFETAGEKNHKFLLNCVEQKIDIVIESIGRSVDVILEQRNYLEKNGYTTYMIMLYAELELCIVRVRNRERSYSDTITTNSWHECYKNISNYKMEFKDKFILLNENNIDYYQFITDNLSGKTLL